MKPEDEEGFLGDPEDLSSLNEGEGSEEPLEKPWLPKPSHFGRRPPGGGVNRTQKVESVPLWAIYDRQTGRPYIQAGWPKGQAERELEEILRPYPPGHAWRNRLFLAGYRRGSKRKEALEGEN